MTAGLRIAADNGVTGLSTYRNAALQATKQAVSTAKTRLYGLHVYNPNSTDAFLQLYDALVANVTVGTTTPTATFWIPALSGLDDQTFTVPEEYNTALVVAATTTVGGSTNPTTGLLVNLFYRG